MDKLTATAVKLAGHLSLSREVIDDWDAFSQYSTSELFKLVTDVENAQLLTGNATTDPGSMNGFYNTSDVLSHDCSADTGTLTTTLDSVEMAIAEMRSGSALAVPDLFVCNPLDWSAMRRLKTSYGEFLLAPDPSGSETNSLWGVEVIVTVQNPAGRALLIDTQKMGG